jgi:hypothetical protein
MAGGGPSLSVAEAFLYVMGNKVQRYRTFEKDNVTYAFGLAMRDVDASTTTEGRWCSSMSAPLGLTKRRCRKAESGMGYRDVWGGIKIKKKRLRRVLLCDGGDREGCGTED